MIVKSIDFVMFNEQISLCQKSESPGEDRCEFSTGSHIVLRHFIEGSETKQIDFNSFSMDDLDAVANAIGGYTCSDDIEYGDQDKSSNKGNLLHEYWRVVSINSRIDRLPKNVNHEDDFI